MAKIIASSRARCLTVALASLALPAQAQSLHPQESWYVTDGEIRTIVEDGGLTYIGGAFRFVGPHTGGGVAFKPSDGQVEPGWPRIDGQVEVVIGDGAGGWYIGGLIKRVAGLPRANIAHILPNGQLGLFQPTVDERVRTLALAGNRLFVGGDFVVAEGQPRNGLAMFAVNDTATPLEPWNPGLPGSVQIYSIALDGGGGKVYVGGAFNGPTSNFGVFDGLSGTDITPGSPNPNGIVKVVALDASAGKVYIGGDFTLVNGAPFGRAARFDLGSAAPDGWNPNADAAVRSLVVTAADVYAGGDFANIGGLARNHIAALDKASGAALAGFDANADADVYALLLAGAELWAGGEFTSVGGQSRSRIAGLAPATGLPTPVDPCATGRVASLALDASGARVFAGGAFTGFNCVVQEHLARLKTSSGELEAGFFVRADAPVNVLQVSGNTLYAGGEFGVLGGEVLPFLGRVDLLTLLADPGWKPEPDAPVRALDVDAANTRVFAGGDFGRVNLSLVPTDRNHAACFLDSPPGQVLGWDPDTDAPVSALEFVAGSPPKVELGGEFTTVNGSTSSPHLAAVSDSSGLLVTSFDVDGRVHDLFSAAALYFGGSFTKVNSATRNNAAAVTSPEPPTAWDPDVAGQVFTLEPDGGDIFIGGAFNAVRSTFRNNIALVDSAVGGLRSWDPNIDGTIRDIHADPLRVYVGGLFDEQGPTLFRQNLAVYCKLGTAPPPTATANGNNRIDLTWPSVSGTASYFVYRRHAMYPWLRIASVPAGIGTITFWDTTVESDVAYQYYVTFYDGCESEPSPVAFGTANGVCNPPPQFDGAVAVEQEAGTLCGVRVFWRGAVQVCGESYAYSVYRGAPGFAPSPANRIVLNAQCSPDCSYLDSAALAGGTTYSYIVRVTDVEVSQTEDDNTFEQIITPAGCTATQPAPLRVFTTRSADGENRMEWVNPGGPYVNTEIRYTVAPAAPPAGPGDGALLGTFAGPAGGKDAVVHDSLANDDTYQYAAFVFAGGLVPYSSRLDSNGRPALAPAEQRWAYKTAATALSPTAVVPGRAYLPVSNDRMVHAITAGDVTALPTPGGQWPAAWQPFAMNEPAQNRPTVLQFSGTPPGGLPQRIALISSQDGRVYCLNADTGAIRWVSPLLGQVLTGSPSVMTTSFGGLVNRVFVGTRNSVGDNQLYGLDLATGALGAGWIFANGGGASGIGIISAQPVVDYQNNRVYFTSRRKGAPGSGSPNTVWAVSITVGGFTFEWAHDYGETDAAASRPQGSNLLIVGNNAGHVRALNSADGSEYWGPGNFFAAGSAIKGFVFPQGTSRLFFSAGGTVFAIDNNGAGFAPSLAWSDTKPSPSTPLVATVAGQAQVFYGAFNGCLYKRDAATGGSVVGVRLGSPASPPQLGQPTLDTFNSRLMLGSVEGRVYVSNLVLTTSDASCLP